MTDPQSDSTIPYERPLRYNDGQYEFTLPADLANNDGLKNGDRFAFLPELQQNSIRFRVVRDTSDEYCQATNARGQQCQNQPSDGEFCAVHADMDDVERVERQYDGTHVRRLRRAGEWDQAYLRFPAAMATERGFPELLQDDGGVQVEIQRVDRGDYILNTWPRTKPWFTPTAGEQVTEAVTKRLVTVGADERDGFTSLRFEFPLEYAEVYGLEGGEPVATRLTARNGELMIALDFGVDDGELDGSHTRTVYRSGVVQAADGDYDRYGVLVAKPYVDALGLAHRELTVIPEDGQILLQSA